MRNPTVRSILNGLTFGVVLWANAAAGSGALSGASIGEIANRYPSAFLPANYTFGIWSLIYLGLLAFVVYQVVPSRRGRPVLERLGAWWMVNGALNIGWIVTFSFERFLVAHLIMLALLGSLIVIHAKVGREDELGAADRIFVAIPFNLYLAWISVALISNTFQVVTYLDWAGFGIPGEVWSAVMMGVATALGLWLARTRRIVVFPMVVAWALAGIANRFPDDALVSGTGWAFVAVGLLGLAVLLVRGRDRRPV